MKLNLNVLALVCVWLVGTAAFGDEAELSEDASEIKRLIPTATAMSRADFLKLANSPQAPSASDVENKSLTLFPTLSPADDDAHRKEFRVSGKGVARPSDMAAEIYRRAGFGKLTFARGPITAIHANRITGFTCEVKGDSAQGTVSFEVPKLYAGQVNYVAQRAAERWKIVQLKLPTYGIHLARDEKDKWIHRESEQ